MTLYCPNCGTATDLATPDPVPCETCGTAVDLKTAATAPRTKVQDARSGGYMRLVEHDRDGDAPGVAFAFVDEDRAGSWSLNRARQIARGISAATGMLLYLEDAR